MRNAGAYERRDVVPGVPYYWFAGMAPVMLHTWIWISKEPVKPYSRWRTHRQGGRLQSMQPVLRGIHVAAVSKLLPIC